MALVLGIESTAHTFGVGVVKNKKIIANVNRSFSTEEGGMIPMDVAKFHSGNKNEIYFKALDKAGITEDKIDAIAFSQGPGLAPCLLVGMKFAKELAKKLKKPIVPVNHCVAHLEVGRLTGAKNPVMLYASGANTQIIAYASGKYRVFGETLDIGVGNFIDTFGRYARIGFPAGPLIEKLALNGTPQAYTKEVREPLQGPEKSSEKIFTRGKKYIELPYKIKGMDVALSGILTNLKQKLEGKSPRDDSAEPKYSLNDLAYSMQETVFAMLVESAERALAHTGKNELLLGGGVACNSRLQEMCRIMCKERGAKFFCPENSLLVDNGAMIAYLGEIMFKSGIREKNPDIKPRQRTDAVDVRWK